MATELNRIEVDKIGWEDGTLVSKAKVQIDGVIHEVEPEEYSGTTPLSSQNLKQMEKNTEKAINEGMAEVVNKAGVVDSGSNANGSWIKFADGTMICSNSFTFSQAINSTSGSIYVGDYTTAKAFPVEFIERPDLTMVTDGRYYACWLGGVSWSATAITKITLNRATSLGSQTLGVSYIAKGRWK
jgi:hypothetical protein